MEPDLEMGTGSSSDSPAPLPRLGFAGAGWIGLNRLNYLMREKLAIPAALYDPDPVAVRAVLDACPGIPVRNSMEELLEDEGIDGIVIATPSALHAGQAIQSLESGKAVFCQKPLGRSGNETERVVEEARKRDLPIEVDFSYRHTRAGEEVMRLLHSGKTGALYSVQLLFHNAWGPGKEWYRDRNRSGGGCLMDLGIHLIDFLFLAMDKERFLKQPEISDCCCHLFRNGRRLRDPGEGVEDYSHLQFVLNGTISVQLSCSWNLQAGKDAVIEMNFYGEKGGAGFRNVDGSFYDFIAESFTGTKSSVISIPPDEWSGRAIGQWASRLASGEGFNPESRRYLHVAEALDSFYQAAWQ